MMNLKKLSTHHHHHHHNPVCLLNRIWRRKFLLIAIILIFLIITISLTNSRLNAFSSLFATNNKFHSKHHQFYPMNGDDGEVPVLGTPSSSRWEEHQRHKDLNKKHHILDGRISRFKQNDNYDDVNNGYGARPLLNAENKQTKLPLVLIHPNNDNQNGYIPKQRLVHFDLKGAPPKISYFREVFPWLQRAGCTGILLEYEDTFPYEGNLKKAVADNAYTKQDIKEIKNLAKRYNLEIIPLIQTLGHLEFFLKLEHYRHLREIDDFPQAICPSKNDSFVLLTDMIDQMLAIHPESKWLHIGCDEVFQIGHCELCRFKDREELFLSHVKRLATYLKEKYNVIPIIWDDMLRTFSYEMVKSYELDKLGVEIMIWTYVDDIYRFIPSPNWMFYSETFPRIWGASAFKGAFGETLTVPNIKMHLDNNIAWLKVLEEQKNNFKSIQGLVITGWQRYDHLGTLCELFPSGFPSLMLNLLTVSQGKFNGRKTLEQFHNLLNCRRNYHFADKIFNHHPNFFHLINFNCDFPGINIFHLMQEFETVNKRVDDYLYDVTIHKAWLTDYNFRHNITSPWRINEGLQDYPNVMYSVKSLVKMAISALSEVYDNSTVYEWIEEKIYPQLLRLDRFYNETMRIRKLKVWPKRPIKPSTDLFRFILKDDDNN